jgi:hypothetical protein
MGQKNKETKMSRVQELEQAVIALPRVDYEEFRRWFLDQDWRQWDQEIEDDSKAGRLDFLVREAAEAKSQKRLRNL